jgi:hypothetical protein
MLRCLPGPECLNPAAELGPVGDPRVRPLNRRLDEPGPVPGKPAVRPGPQPPRGRLARPRAAPGWEGPDAGAQDAIILSVDDRGQPPGPGGGAAGPPVAGGPDPGPPGSRPPHPGPPAGPADPLTGPSGAALARRPAPAALAVRRPPPAAPRPVPSWGTVLLTTIRLWAQRRLHRPAAAGPARRRPVPAPPRSAATASAPARPGPARPAAARPRRRWRLGAILALAVLLFAGGAVTVALTRGPGSPAPRPGPSRALSSAAIRAAAAARAQAASWITAQAATGAIVACDPQMCADLQRAGVPASRLLVLGRGGAGPLGSDLIVATAAVRAEFGARLTSVYAPVAVAAFGAGSAQAAIRVVAPDGSAAYLSALRTDQAARVSAGQQLLRNQRIHVSAPVRQAMTAGQVDSRLLTVLAGLATMHAVNVLDVGTATPGASPALPLRWADIASAGRLPHHPHWPNSIGSLSRFLRAQLAPYRPASITSIRLNGRAALRVGFAAPSPLGLLGKS